MTPEERVLLASARLPGDPHAAAALVAVTAGAVEWNTVLRRTREEGTAALLHAHLGAHPAVASHVPRAVRVALAMTSEATWARNVVLTERWREAIAALATRGIPALTLKGMALVHTCYASPALRPMADIDLLVGVDDVAAARETLAGLGYHGVGGDVAAHYAHFVRDGAVLDLHWDLADYPRVARVLSVDHAGVWRRARRFTVDGAEALTLSPEDTLVYLALHLTLGSEFGRMIWFTDLLAVMRTFDDGLDWSHVVEEARRWRVAVLLGHTLGIAASALDAPVPAAVIRDLRPGRLRTALAARVVDQHVPPSLRGAVAAPRAYAAESLLLDSPGDIARSLVTTFFPPRAWLRAHYAATTRRAIVLRRIAHPVRVCGLALGALVGGHSR